MFNSKLLKDLKLTVNITGDLELVETTLSTDSRSIVEGEIFLALSGDSFDGFSYIEKVLDIGILAVVYLYTNENYSKIQKYYSKHPACCFIGVKDTLLSLQEIATKRISEWKSLGPNQHVIGITGSNGKTTNKEMLYHLLSEVFPEEVYATRENYNNHIGVPKTILELKDSHTLAIIEMGTNHMGEIPVLTKIAQPDSGLITNIGCAHIEHFEKEENILTEKGDLYSSVVKNTNGLGIFIVNKDDKYLSTLVASMGMVTFSEVRADYLLTISKNKLSLKSSLETIEFINENIFEKYNFKNLAATFLLALKLFPNKKEQFIEAASTLKLPSNNRSQWIVQGDKKIYLDAYNANPSSMEASLSSFCSYLEENSIKASDCYFILGDMNELGELAQEKHGEISRLAYSKGIRHIAFVGRYAEYYDEAYCAKADIYKDKAEFENIWPELKTRYKYFFIKASRSLQLESLIDIN